MGKHTIIVYVGQTPEVIIREQPIVRVLALTYI